MNQRAHNILHLLLTIMPIGIFLIKGWISSVLFVCSALSLFIIISGQLSGLKNQPAVEKTNSLRWFYLILIMLIFPVTAVIISSVLRNEWIWPDFDSPFRFLLAAPIFYVVFKHKLNLINRWQYILPLTLVVTLLALPFIHSYYPGQDPFKTRMGTYFVDPLTFGWISLTFSLLTLFSINLDRKEHWSLILFKIIGAGIGFYFSMKSQSRTGWLAIPFIFFLFVFTHGPKNKVVSMLTAFIVSLVLIAAIYQSFSVVKQRVSEGYDDIVSYKMNDVNELSSLGERISFARMGFYYFSLNPVLGWGHNGFNDHVNDAEISAYANEHTRHTPGGGGLFHNELVTNAVAFGVWGIIYTVLLFFVPLALFITSWRKKINPKICALGVVYIICEVISSFSTEVFALKFTASFHAVFLSCFCATILAGLSNASRSNS